MIRKSYRYKCFVTGFAKSFVMVSLDEPYECFAKNFVMVSLDEPYEFFTKVEKKQKYVSVCYQLNLRIKDY